MTYMAHGADSHSSLEGISGGFVVFACGKADLIRCMSISLIHGKVRFNIPRLLPGPYLALAPALKYVSSFVSDREPSATERELNHLP
jgi:hypothetical protein